MRAIAAVILYLLALDSLACAALAWGEAAPRGLVGWAIGLAVALGIGERLGDPFSEIEAKRRDRVAVFLGTLQLSLLILALLLATARPTPDRLRFLTGVLSGYLLLVLALVRLTPYPRGVVGQSLALVALACLRGGPLAAWAAGSSLAFVGLYVGLDHHARLLAAHRVDDSPHATRALSHSALLVLPVALAVSLGAYLAAPGSRASPPPEVADESYRPIDEKPRRELDSQALRSILIAGLAGAVAVYLVGRWIVRSKRGERKSIETPEPLRGTLERIRPEVQRTHVARTYAGRRGRIVRAYLRLLRAAEELGFPRRPDETPVEFASALGEPREALAEATEVFLRARYGPFDLTGGDVAQADRSAAAVLSHLKRHPPRRREDVVRDVRAPSGRGD
jgi:hypothetical protein